MGRARVLVIGLDCAAPALVFDRYRDAMPNVSRLMHRGLFGELHSSVPPITVPAWACMTSGRDAGEIGVYGFRDRKAGSYELSLVDSSHIQVERVWDMLAKHGLTSSLLFVPPNYPPREIARGESLGCFLTPSADNEWTSPSSLGDELRLKFGDYVMDVEGVRGGDKHTLLRDLRTMTEQHFAIARDRWVKNDPDFMMMVEIGPDRLHHALWNAMDPAHPRPSNDRVLQEGARDYYALLDREIGSLLALTDDDTTVLVVSDHGARAMQGGVCINEWLIENGWLVLHEKPSGVAPLKSSMVDWSRTRAWGEGGYYARIFLNVQGREPNGIVRASELERTRNELGEGMRAICYEAAHPFDTRVVNPRAFYRKALGNAPDLCVFFDNLAWRSIGSIGHGRCLVSDNDQGEDGCNHDWQGIFVMAGRGVEKSGARTGLSIYDITPTVLSLFDIAIPSDLLGHDVRAIKLGESQ